MILVSEIYYSRMTGLNESSVNQRKLIMTANKKNQEFKIRKSDGILSIVSGILTDILICLFFPCCRNCFMGSYARYFRCLFDSWMADPKLLNFQYMWNVL